MGIEVSMQGKYKPFSNELFRDNDSRAIEAVTNYLCKQGEFASRNKEKYQPDIVVYGSAGFQKASYVEVEVKRVWRNDQPEFPWDSVQIPERKLKYLRKRLEVEFWVLRSDLQYAVVVPGIVVGASPLVEVPNKLVSTGEKFVQIPLNQCTLVQLVGGE